MKKDLIKSSLQKIIDSSDPSVSFSIITPDWTIKKYKNKKDDFVIHIKDRSFWKEIATKETLGVGEQFMLGNLEITGDFDKAIITLVSLSGKTEIAQSSFWLKVFKRVLTSVYPQTRNKALRNVAYHYDLGNDFFQKWLDPSMTYSCAYFKKSSDSLTLAQEQKYEHNCRKLQLKPGESLIDVGCGWGGMLIYAAQKYKVSGYGVTLSKNQFEYGNKKVKELNLDKLVKFELKDYRDINGQFDKFVSIGMFEHVTARYHDAFFKKIVEVLKPGGIGVLHTIGKNIPNEVPEEPWIQTYIFPGAQIPTAQSLFHFCGKYNLPPQDFENLRLHYALTLKRWADNYMANYDEEVQERGEKFARMWKWYLYSCRAGFLNNLVQLYQLTFTKGFNNGYPLTRERIYA